MGQLEAPAKVATLRRDLARIKTVLRERDTTAPRERDTQR
jgi:ribosomal protein L29